MEAFDAAANNPTLYLFPFRNPPAPSPISMISSPFWVKAARSVQPVLVVVPYKHDIYAAHDDDRSRLESPVPYAHEQYHRASIGYCNVQMLVIVEIRDSYRDRVKPVRRRLH